MRRGASLALASIALAALTVTLSPQNAATDLPGTPVDARDPTVPEVTVPRRTSQQLRAALAIDPHAQVPHTEPRTEPLHPLPDGQDASRTHHPPAPMAAGGWPGAPHPDAPAVEGSTDAPRAEIPRLALVIDDLGWDDAVGQRTLALPGPLTVAVLPHTPLAAPLARAAHASGHEVILHQPMAPLGGQDPGPGALDERTPHDDVGRILAANLAELPFLAGVSNHMGSRLTTQGAAMDAVMRALAGRGLYFLDSRTIAGTVALDRARAHAIPATARDVFLDDDRDVAAIAAALESAVRLAEARGFAVAIGHPYPETLELLERLLPTIQGRVRLVPVSALARTPGPSPTRLVLDESVGG